MASTVTNAAGVRWDTTELCGSAEEAQARYGRLVEWAGEIAERYRGRIGELDAAGFRELLEEIDRHEQEHAKVHFYCLAREHTLATDAETNDLVTFARDRRSELESLLVFIEIEWVAVPDDRAEQLLASTELAPYAHRLGRARAEKPYMLSEAEEQALNARRPVISAWQTLHGKQLATIEVPFDAGNGEEPHTIDRLLSYAHAPDRDVRREALATLYRALEPIADVQAAAYDAIVGDGLSMDRPRGYPPPMAATHLANELDDPVVETMMSAIESN